MQGSGLGKWLILLGLAIAAMGLVVTFLSKWFHLGHLPGDIFLQRGNFSFYFPLATCLILSIVLSIIFNIFRR